jgi:hypothetical protein
MMEEKAKEFIRLYHLIDKIVDSDASWETKYKLVFSDDVAGKIRETGISFDCLIFDTTYEDDTLGFYNGVKDKAIELILIFGC